jgi:hypothetical protein
MHFIHDFHLTNPILFWFTLTNVLFAVFFMLLTFTSKKMVNGVNAFYKPLKFASSTAIYLATMAWFCSHLPMLNCELFSWVNVFLFTFEVGYIAIQAAREQPSHFNTSTPLYSALFALMGLAAVLIALYGAYVGWLFFTFIPSTLSPATLWAIRLGIILFFVFSLEGLLMGNKLSHAVGKAPDHKLVPLFKWSRANGDLRIAHFVGMHAIQVLPLLSLTIVSSTIGIVFVSLLYFLFAIYVFLQALKGQPLFRYNKIIHR